MGPDREAGANVSGGCGEGGSDGGGLGWEGGCGAEARRHLTRTFSVFPDDDGMYVVRGRLDPEVGAALMRAIEAASDALYRGERGDDEMTPTGRPGGNEDEATPEQRRADALGLVAERGLAAGFGDGPLSGSRAERYQVVLHVEEAGLRDPAVQAAAAHDARQESAAQAATHTAHVSAETSEDGPPTPRPLSELEDGVRVSAETSRRLACDASAVRVTRELDVGRRTRTIAPSLRRALEPRDRGCRFPGCRGRFTDAHNIEHWADVGETRLENLVLLCRRHHRAVHEGRTRVCRGADDSVVFFAPRGRALYDAPKRSMNGHRAARVDDLRLDRPSWRKGAARWGRYWDVPWAIEVRALDAVEAAAGD